MLAFPIPYTNKPRENGQQNMLTPWGVQIKSHKSTTEDMIVSAHFTHTLATTHVPYPTLLPGQEPGVHGSSSVTTEFMARQTWHVMKVVVRNMLILLRGRFLTRASWIFCWSRGIPSPKQLLSNIFKYSTRLLRTRVLCRLSNSLSVLQEDCKYIFFQVFLFSSNPFLFQNGKKKKKRTNIPEQTKPLQFEAQKMKTFFSVSKSFQSRYRT